MNIAKLIFDVLVLVILVLASVSDIKTRLVPTKYQYALLACSVAHVAYVGFIEKNSVLMLNCILSGVFVFAIYIAMVLIFKTGIGGADTKVTSLMALFLGWQQTICFVIAHCITALAYTGYMSVAKKKKIKSVPLMPFLVAGYVITKIIWALMPLF
jgi:Flp pilus assembly protein protease CpaA